MRLSKLQKYILMKCYENKTRREKKQEFYYFYREKDLKKNKIAVQVALQNSLENLVKKDLVVAYGYKTQKKWYIERVKLTTAGKRTAKELIKNRQRRLPIK